MLIKTILNSLEKFKSFIYGNMYFETIKKKPSLIIEILARKNSQGKCVSCGKSSPGYDVQPIRRYQYVPLWNVPVYFQYAPRRINCITHGIRVELVPWSKGKEHLTKSYQIFCLPGQSDYLGRKLAAFFQRLGIMFFVQ